MSSQTHLHLYEQRLRYPGKHYYSLLINPGSVAHISKQKMIVFSIDLFAVESHWDKLSKSDIGKIQCDASFNLVKGEGVLQSS